MTTKHSKEQMNNEGQDPADHSGDTHSGNPNPTDPNEQRSTEHKSGYGGEAGEPRTSSDERQRPTAKGSGPTS